MSNVNTATAADTNNDTTPKTNTSTTPDFGHGRFSSATLELYRDLGRLTDMDGPTREKIARDWSADIGRAFAAAPASVKHGKSKDGKMSLADASKVKGAMETRNMTLARLVEHINAAAKAAGPLNARIRFTVEW